MLTSIPTQRPAEGHVFPRSYNVARPTTVQTDVDADAFVASLLNERDDVELLSDPVLGRDRMGRPVVVVTVKPAGARLLASPVPVFTLTAQA